ncbi:MAG: hypothetical protein WEA09_12715 [Gemmatimonadota bacterium]
MKIVRSALILLVSASLAGCASAATGASGRSANLITQQELMEMTSGLSAFQAVERLRPRWLGRQSASLQAASSAGVVVDGMTRGGLELLQGMRVENIAEMRYLPARDATNRYGSGYPAGVIEVVTRNAAGS